MRARWAAGAVALVVVAGASLASAAPGFHPPTGSSPRPSQDSDGCRVVEPGDNLWAIIVGFRGFATGALVDEFAAYNGLDDPALIFPGQVVCDPATAVTSTTVPPSSSTSTTQPPTTTTTTTTTVPPSTTEPPEPVVGFREAFDDPVAWRDRVEVEVHHDTDFIGRPLWHPSGPVTWLGDHGLDCPPPDPVTGDLGSRPLDAWASDDPFDPDKGQDDTGPVYWCRGHVMTSMGSASGRSYVALSPLEIFPTVSRICWDVNVTNLTARTWYDVVVTPAATGLRDENGDYRLSHAPGRAGFNNPFGVALPVAETVQVKSAAGDGVRAYVGGDAILHTGRGADPEGSASKAIRREHCWTQLADGLEYRVRTGDQSPDHVVLMPGVSFPTDARVVFEHGAYNPAKDSPDGFTLHWDNLTVDP